ncbi:MAG: alpha/beta fold hydrolase [Solirubrobacterales bacterium]
MPTLAIRDFEVHWSATGSGPAVVCLHDTATDGRCWDPLVAALDGSCHTVVYDRRGWGRSSAPETYLATTVVEQAEDARAVAAAALDGPAVLCGAGLGAVICLELAASDPRRWPAVIAIEPPLFAFSHVATEQLSADRAAIDAVARSRGPAAVARTYLDGELPGLGPAAGRTPTDLQQPAVDRPLAVFAELGSVPAWPLRFDRLRAVGRSVYPVYGADASPLLAGAARMLVERAGTAKPLVTDPGLPHWAHAAELAELVASVARRALAAR